MVLVPVFAGALALLLHLPYVQVFKPSLVLESVSLSLEPVCLVLAGPGGRSHLPDFCEGFDFLFELLGLLLQVGPFFCGLGFVGDILVL